MMFGMHKEKNGYVIKEPKNDFRKSFGYVMVCNPKGEILKFFDINHLEEANKYLSYVSLSKYDKFKYWLNYKREGRRK